VKGVEDLLDQASAGSIIHLKRAEQNKEVMQRVARIVPFKPVEEVRTKARSGGFSKKSVACRHVTRYRPPGQGPRGPRQLRVSCSLPWRLYPPKVRLVKLLDRYGRFLDALAQA